MRGLARILRFLAAAAALGFAAATPAQAPAPGAYFWEVTALTNRIYLFGTVHAGKAAWYPLPPVVETALADSKVLVVEANVTDDAAIAKSSGGMVYKPPDTLAKNVRPEDYARFRKLVARYALPEAQIAQLKPFVAVSVLVFSEWARLGYLANYGVDAYLIRKAHAEAKPILELEGVATQAALLDSLTAEEGRIAFQGALDALESGLASEQITGMVNAWQAGDPELLLEVARKYNSEVKGAEAFEEKFIWARHDDMLKKIEGYLNHSRDRHFVAVGALHLAGPRGLVELLRKKGYVVRQR